MAKLAVLLEAAHERLTSVVIEQLPYGELIRRYDRAETLFYLDPPYWGNEADYGGGVFGREDFSRLAELLAGIQGRFLLSLNDRPEVREAFAGFEIEAVATTYMVGTSHRPGGQRVGEVLIGGLERRAT